MMAPASRPAAEAMWAAMPKPAQLPSYSALLADADGMLWVMLYRASADAEQDWLVLDRSGRLVQRVRLQPAVRLLDAASGTVLLLTRDSLDIERVEAFRLREAFAT